MKRDKETKNKLLECAREEFMEKGYMNASLRNICKKAEVTTGALYFFFKDKDDLFQSLVKDTVEELQQIMLKHFQGEQELAVKGMITPEVLENGNHDMEDSIQAIHQMYLHREDMLLVLTKSQGSSFDHIEDWFVEKAENQFRTIADCMNQQYPEVVIDDNVIHWVAHMMIYAFVYMITHIENEQEAMKYIEKAITYMVTGWFGMFKKD